MPKGGLTEHIEDLLADLEQALEKAKGCYLPSGIEESR